jgi:hypothetical protein
MRKLNLRSVFLVAQIVAPVAITACRASTALQTVATSRLDASGGDRVGRSYGVILPDEINAAGVMTAYDAIARLRPRYLEAHRLDAQGRPVQPVVVIRRGMPESLDALRAIHVDAIAEIRFVEPRDVGPEFDSRHAGGVVLVRLVTSVP